MCIGIDVYILKKIHEIEHTKKPKLLLYRNYYYLWTIAIDRDPAITNSVKILYN